MLPSRHQSPTMQHRLRKRNSHHHQRLAWKHLSIRRTGRTRTTMALHRPSRSPLVCPCRKATLDPYRAIQPWTTTSSDRHTRNRTTRRRVIMRRCSLEGKARSLTTNRTIIINNKAKITTTTITTTNGGPRLHASKSSNTTTIITMKSVLLGVATSSRPPSLRRYRIIRRHWKGIHRLRSAKCHSLDQSPWLDRQRGCTSSSGDRGGRIRLETMRCPIYLVIIILLSVIISVHDISSKWRFLLRFLTTNKKPHALSRRKATAAPRKRTSPRT